jgi:hypothetical protein
MKKVLLILTFIFVLMIAGCSSPAQPEVNASTAKAEIIIVVDEKPEIITVEFNEGTNLMELMKANFEIETAFEDSFIIGIDGLLADDSAKMGWMYYINGDFAMKGANEFIPEDGDLIEFKYESWK